MYKILPYIQRGLSSVEKVGGKYSSPLLSIAIFITQTFTCSFSHMNHIMHKPCFHAFSKSVNIGSTYEITETISQHFLVDETARDDLEEFMLEIKGKMVLMNVKVRQC